VESAAVLAEGHTVLSYDLPQATDRQGAAGPKGFHSRVADFEKKLLVEALEATPNRKKAAAELQLSYDQFRRLLKKHHL